MQTRILIAAALWWVTCTTDGLGAATLYPIVSSGPEEKSQRAASQQIAPTNQTAEVFTASVTLKPTSIAAAGAGGFVELKGRALSLHVHHLDPGRYELQVIKKSTGNFDTLGTLTIVDPTLGPDRQANDNKKEASAHS